MAYVATDDGVAPIRLGTNKALRPIKISNRPVAVNPVHVGGNTVDDRRKNGMMYPASE